MVNEGKSIVHEGCYMRESEFIEFKAEDTDDLCRAVVAFANTDGGTIRVGVDDSGNVIGLPDMDADYTRITNLIRDNIRPDVTLFTRYETTDERCIFVHVAEGTAKPYFLASKGLKPAGVYMRQGASSVQASWEQIRLLIKNADGDSYEATRSLLQDLSFAAAEQEFGRRGILFEPEKYSALGLYDESKKMLTNLALLLSDQCEHSVKVAVFDDEANTVFRDRREFGGSVLRQLHESYEYLMLNNRVASKIRGLDREDREDYPPEAIREALLNSLVHRDYSYSGSVIININRNRIEFINLGGLLPGISPRDITSGISQPRNAKLAQIFFRLKHIEAYGTGLRRIFALYRDEANQPEIDVTENTFRISLPNRNAVRTVGSGTGSRLGSGTGSRVGIVSEPKASYGTRDHITPQMQSVLDYLEEHGTIADAALPDFLGVKRTRAYLVARQMLELGLLQSSGRGKTKKYFRRNS